MKTSAEIRQASLLKILEGFSADVDLATKLKKHRNQVFLWKTKAIGDKAAREIERGLGYERGWLDHLHDKDLVPNYPKLSILTSSVEYVRRVVHDIFGKQLHNLPDKLLATMLLQAYDDVFKQLELSSRSGKPALSNENVLDITSKLAAKMRAHAGASK